MIKIEGGDEFDLQALEEPSQTSSGEQIKQEKNDVDENGAKKNGKSIKKKHGNGKKRKLSGDEEESGGSESGAYSDSSSSDDEKAEEDDVNDQANPNQQSAKKRIPQQLHRTTSIFLRNLPPSTTKVDLENLFKAHKGFKRIALSDPAPERGFFRRGWATFDANVNIKDICWSLNNVKVKDFNPGAIVNRDLNKRVRPTTSHICHHKPVVRNDIKIATKIIQNLDKRWNLWNNSVAEVDKVVPKIEVEPNENDKIKEVCLGGYFSFTSVSRNWVRRLGFRGFTQYKNPDFKSSNGTLRRGADGEGSGSVEAGLCMQTSLFHSLICSRIFHNSNRNDILKK